jgi:hypothetical protein
VRGDRWRRGSERVRGERREKGRVGKIRAGWSTGSEEEGGCCTQILCMRTFAADFMHTLQVDPQRLHWYLHKPLRGVPKQSLEVVQGSRLVPSGVFHECPCAHAP